MSTTSFEEAAKDMYEAFCLERNKTVQEACAQICDAQQLEGECPERARYCAEAIRARGNP